ncbi:hypothetical protein CLAFUW4_02006 [Fulvia fulva]|uniref:Uncharacterized protein n=1 Tax=Passalora fulva TaxID=5499 RepID=A0A9Q8P2M1_PASFU|nr:uncharacterized protein CLAFUR5_01999 [Fulvia fulva]KAK4635680.1 hypothetical protein CLAFUR4_02001 [Fulvia fulva]KAK4637733.1 hypothetical protein CLAFUR0_02003 [Fulvia fulva]UJO11085.1 hypothetical protein CLAFUR5_01999 [Fulvia fulva]WPV08164.1 hypothetical protein CLAFUW4_02006 [Fulvia fulva]WPV24425.1 hypothetical protein CLAFUW7_02006 [Fulvia fulva]
MSCKVGPLSTTPTAKSRCSSIINVHFNSSDSSTNASFHVLIMSALSYTYAFIQLMAFEAT